MILRRLTKHVKDQNWFAVALDFIIVVVGVFIGMQVGNWNNAAQERAKEEIVLEQLAEEFTSTVETAKNAKRVLALKLEATRDVLRVIRDGKEPADKVSFLQTLSQASSYQSGPSEPVTLVELLSSGGLSRLSAPDLRAALVQYHEISIEQADLADLVLQRISTPHDGFHNAIHVNPDFDPTLDNRLERYDWDLIGDTRQQFQILLYGKLGLQFHINQQITRGEAVLNAIKKAQ
jgi:hypothetical protein